MLVTNHIPLLFERLYTTQPVVERHHVFPLYCAVGQHQLESAQLSIKLRELTQQFQEACEEKASCEAERDKASAEMENMLRIREEEMRSSEAVEKKHAKEVAALNREIKQNEKR